MDKGAKLQRREEREMAEPVVKILPHSPKEFKTAEELTNWLGVGLKAQGGVYLVPTMSRRRGIPPGSVCLFMKDKKIVGEGVVKESVQKYEGKEISPATGKPFEGMISFEPSSLRRYVRPLELELVQQLSGRKLTPRFLHSLTWDDYGNLLAEVVKAGFY